MFADDHDNVVHLFERDCSSQRRYQKIIEECPSPSIDNRTRRVLQGYAKKFLNYTQYAGAGTLKEFSWDNNNSRPIKDEENFTIALNDYSYQRRKGILQRSIVKLKVSLTI